MRGEPSQQVWALTILGVVAISAMVGVALRARRRSRTRTLRVECNKVSPAPGVWIVHDGSHPSPYADRVSGPQRAYASSGLDVSSRTLASCLAATTFTG